MHTKFKIRGYNPFYEGWLARVLLKDGDGQHDPPQLGLSVEQPVNRATIINGQPIDMSDQAGFLLGWNTADESYGTGIGDVLLMEIDKGHVIIESE